MGRGSNQGGAMKGKRQTVGKSFIEGRSFGDDPRFTSANDRKATRRALEQSGRPGHIRREKQPNPKATTKPGRRKN